MDNRIFNVNGEDLDMLGKVLALAFEQRWSIPTKATGYRIDPKKGFILLWSCEKSDVYFPCPLNAESVTAIVWEWLQSKPGTECADWDANCDHDGDNSMGWRVYCEDWGHVISHYAIVAVKPAYLWHGK